LRASASLEAERKHQQQRLSPKKQRPAERAIFLIVSPTAGGLNITMHNVLLGRALMLTFALRL
jgi:hypothetical protein